MSTNFPTNLDTSPTRTDGDVIYAAHVQNVQDAVVALQTKVGVDNSAVTTTLDYITKHLPVANISATGTPSGGNFLRGDGTWSSSGNLAWGDASDGTVVLDGINTYSFFTKNSNTYTLTRDIFTASITINNGITLIENGYAIYASGSIVNAGTIHNNGSDGQNGAYMAGSLTTEGQGGAGGAGATFTAGTTGSAGGLNNSNGVAGANKTCLGTTGGKGGNCYSDSKTGGAAGTATSETVLLRVPATTVNLTAGTEDVGSELYRLYASTNLKSLSTSAGAGGGASANSSGSIGGGGGGSGGVVFLAAPTITNTGSITSNGGAGGAGALNEGSGGGGAGGTIFLIYRTLTAGTITATGGAKGTKAPNAPGGASEATNGSDGKIYKVKLSASITT